MELTEAAARAQLIQYYARLYGALDAAADDMARLAAQERQSTNIVRAISGAAKRDAEEWSREATRQRDACMNIIDAAEQLGITEFELQRMATALAIERALLAAELTSK